MNGTVTKLYSTEVLALAAGLSEWPYDATMPLLGQSRSPSCGSVLNISLKSDGSGRIVAIGLSSQACAIGQASAAIFAAHATGATEESVRKALAEVMAWLVGEASLPSWPGMEVLVAARDFPARHGAILLPWKAALDALP